MQNPKNTDDLTKLCADTIAAYTADRMSVSGATYAHLAKRLIAAEVRPGGPYKDTDGQTSVKLNATIGRMFLLMGRPLASIDAFISGLELSHLSADDQLALRQYAEAKQSRLAYVPQTVQSAPYILAQAVLRQTHEPLRSQALQFLGRINKADANGEIAFMARYTAEAFGVSIAPEHLNQLGEANIYGWIAYSIYDHIIDNESRPVLLPVANVAMRLALAGYQRMFPADHPLQRHISECFNQVDEANAWELKHCRFTVSNKIIHIQPLPNYQQHAVLARRTGIHVLGSMAAIYMSPIAHNQFIINDLAEGLHHYLIARQLCDDIHDWQQDLAAGHISAVVAQLLQYSNVTPATYDLAQLSQFLRHTFLHTIALVIDPINAHIHMAANHFKKAGCKPGKLFGLVERLKSVTDTTVREQARFLEFSKTY
ncbi:MAG TPA: hypothetical protein VFO38_03125 [Candidatus Saccharimonadales bacterium]|nr:hypothetical protein [Candidatus Saccharimonadales bacterium]